MPRSDPSLLVSGVVKESPPKTEVNESRSTVTALLMLQDLSTDIKTCEAAVSGIPREQQFSGCLSVEIGR